MKRRVFSVFLSLLLGLALLVTPAFAEEIILPDETEEILLEETELAEQEIVSDESEEAEPEEQEITATEAADPDAGSVELSDDPDAKIDCWLDGTRFYFTADEENLDYYALEIWEYNRAVNDKLFRFYFYPKVNIIYIVSVSSVLEDSYFKEDMRYDVSNHMFKQNGVYQIDLFEYFELKERMEKYIPYEYEYMCDAEINYKDGTYEYKSTPWYNGADLLGQKRTIQGYMQRDSYITYVGENVTYNYTITNVKNTSDLQFQWMRANSKYFESDDAMEPIPGATQDYYQITAEDVGKFIRLVITAKDYIGDVRGKYIQVTDEIPLDEAHFPDAWFRNKLAAYDNSPENGRLSVWEIKHIKSLDLHHSNIESIEGIRFLTCLEEVNLSENSIIHADFSDLDRLRIIDLSWNSIDTLYLDGCSGLEELSLANNMGTLKSLDLSDFPQLRSLDIRETGMTTLDLRKAGPLLRTALYGKITDESGNPKDPRAPVYTGNSIYTLADSVLKITDFAGSGLEVYLADFSADRFPCEEFQKMIQARCSDTDGILSLSECQGLQTIDFGDADPYYVTSLVGIEYLPWLDRLMTGEEWRLENANLTMNKELTYLDLGGNPLGYISVIENRGLETLILSGCGLKTIDLSQNHLLQSANLGHNELESIKLIPAGQSNSLKGLLVEGNELTDDFDISAQPYLEKLYCYGNHIRELNVSKNPYLKEALKDGVKTTASTPYKYNRFYLAAKGYDLRVDTGTNVWTVKITGLSLPKKYEVPAKSSAVLERKFKPSNTDQTRLRWKSSDDSIAKVNQNGEVTGVTRGTVTITATSRADSSIKASCEVTVKFSDAYYKLNGTGESTVTKEMEKAIEWAADKKITGEKATFGTMNSMTRGQFVRFLYRYAGNPKVTESMIKKYGAKFTDVDKDYTHFKAIVWAVSEGLINGYTENGQQVFKPNKSLSRNNVATILWKFAGSPKVENPNKPFSDVAKSMAIAWGKSEKIFTGTKFYPKKDCIRGDFALFLYRYDKAK